MNARPPRLADVLRAVSPRDRELLTLELRKPNGLWKGELDAELFAAVRAELSRIECEELDRADLAEAASLAAEVIGRAARPAPAPRKRRKAP